MTEAFNPALFELRGDVAWITLNRPAKRNAMSPALNEAMHGALDRVEVDPACRALVLRGAGGHFSAGMDVQEFLVDSAALGPVEERRVHERAHGWWRRLRLLPKPTVAMVEGVCMGGAFAPLFACDVAIAADDAVFGLPEIDLGILSVANITKIVGDLMGRRKAAFYLLSGQPFDGRRAEASDLVTEAVPQGRLEARVAEVAVLLAAKDPLAYQATKETLARALELSFAEAEDYIDMRQVALNGLQGTTPAAKALAMIEARRQRKGQ